MSGRPRHEPIDGAPFQRGDRVFVAQVVDVDTDPDDSLALSSYVGASGAVEYLEYDCGCGQSFPADPMIGVVTDDGRRQEFWREELVRT